MSAALTRGSPLDDKEREKQMQDENEKLRTLLTKVRRHFSWGCWINEAGESVGDASEGERTRLVDRSLCEEIDAALHPQ